MSVTSLEVKLAAAAGATVIIIGLLWFLWRRPRRLKVKNYIGDWKQLQAFCKDKTTWYQALVDADKLLYKALKKRKYKGKRMGERLAAAQHDLTNNDAIWLAHKLTKKVIDNPTLKLRESTVKAALVAYRQALMDIGALPNGQSRNT